MAAFASAADALRRAMTHHDPAAGAPILVPDGRRADELPAGAINLTSDTVNPDGLPVGVASLGTTQLSAHQLAAKRVKSMPATPKLTKSVQSSSCQRNAPKSSPHSYHSTSLIQRRAVGEEIAEFRRQSSSPQYMAEFIRTRWGELPREQHDKLRSYCNRCLDQYVKHRDNVGVPDAPCYRGKRPAGFSASKTALFKRMRAEGGGRPRYAPAIGDELYQFFIDMATDKTKFI